MIKVRRPFVNLAQPPSDALSLQEFRLLFISMLRSSYKYQIRSGELEDRQILAIALAASLDFAEDSVNHGSELKDWDYLQAFDGSLSSIARNLKKKLKFCKGMWGKRGRTNLNDSTKRLLIERSLSL